eukprot:GHVH01010669.1.p1 GENE.GHVH01010669.1~~GHVH01010669.1.p1  ORF type:complete len:1537 (+),score=231.93 GHVH01010669.1:135-4613(+)
MASEGQVVNLASGLVTTTLFADPVVSISEKENLMRYQMKSKDWLGKPTSKSMTDTSTEAINARYECRSGILKACFQLLAVSLESKNILFASALLDRMSRRHDRSSVVSSYTSVSGRVVVRSWLQTLLVGADDDADIVMEVIDKIASLPDTVKDEVTGTVTNLILRRSQVMYTIVGLTHEKHDYFFPYLRALGQHSTIRQQGLSVISNVISSANYEQTNRLLCITSSHFWKHLSSKCFDNADGFYAVEGLLTSLLINLQRLETKEQCFISGLVGNLLSHRIFSAYIDLKGKRELLITEQGHIKNAIQSFFNRQENYSNTEKLVLQFLGRASSLAGGGFVDLDHLVSMIGSFKLGFNARCVQAILSSGTISDYLSIMQCLFSTSNGRHDRSLSFNDMIVSRKGGNEISLRWMTKLLFYLSLFPCISDEAILQKLTESVVPFEASPGSAAAGHRELNDDIIIAKTVDLFSILMLPGNWGPGLFEKLHKSICKEFDADIGNIEVLCTPTHPAAPLLHLIKHVVTIHEGRVKLVQLQLLKMIQSIPLHSNDTYLTSLKNLVTRLAEFTSSRLRCPPVSLSGDSSRFKADMIITASSEQGLPTETVQEGSESDDESDGADFDFAVTESKSKIITNSDLEPCYVADVFSAVSRLDYHLLPSSVEIDVKQSENSETPTSGPVVASTPEDCPLMEYLDRMASNLVIELRAADIRTVSHSPDPLGEELLSELSDNSSACLTWKSSEETPMQAVTFGGASQAREGWKKLGRSPALSWLMKALLELLPSDSVAVGEVAAFIATCIICCSHLTWKSHPFSRHLGLLDEIRAAASDSRSAFTMTFTQQSLGSLVVVLTQFVKVEYQYDPNHEGEEQQASLRRNWANYTHSHADARFGFYLSPPKGQDLYHLPFLAASLDVAFPTERNLLQRLDEDMWSDGGLPAAIALPQPRVYDPVVFIPWLRAELRAALIYFGEYLRVDGHTYERRRKLIKSRYGEKKLIVRKLRAETTDESGKYGRYDEVDVNGSWSYALATEIYIKGILPQSNFTQDDPDDVERSDDSTQIERTHLVKPWMHRIDRNGDWLVELFDCGIGSYLSLALSSKDAGVRQAAISALNDIWTGLKITSVIKNEIHELFIGNLRSYGLKRRKIQSGRATDSGLCPNDLLVDSGRDYEDSDVCLLLVEGLLRSLRSEQHSQSSNLPRFPMIMSSFVCTTWNRVRHESKVVNWDMVNLTTLAVVPFKATIAVKLNEPDDSENTPALILSNRTTLSHIRRMLMPSVRNVSESDYFLKHFSNVIQCRAARSSSTYVDRSGKNKDAVRMTTLMDEPDRCLVSLFTAHLLHLIPLYLSTNEVHSERIHSYLGAYSSLIDIRTDPATIMVAVAPPASGEVQPRKSKKTKKTKKHLQRVVLIPQFGLMDYISHLNGVSFLRILHLLMDVVKPFTAYNGSNQPPRLTRITRRLMDLMDGVITNMSLLSDDAGANEQLDEFNAQLESLRDRAKQYVIK